MEEKVEAIGDYMQRVYPDLDPTMPEFTKARDREQAKRNISNAKTNGNDSVRNEAIGNIKKQKRDGTGGGKMKNALGKQAADRKPDLYEQQLANNKERDNNVNSFLSSIGFGSK